MSPSQTLSIRRFPARHHMALALIAVAALVACNNDDDDNKDPRADVTVSSLRLIGQQVLPRRMDYAGTVVGGLSGIDYDARSDSYVLISDDRTTTDSAGAPRLSTARLSFDARTFSAVTLTGRRLELRLS